MRAVSFPAEGSPARSRRSPGRRWRRRPSPRRPPRCETVSGASYTSDGFRRSLQSALVAVRAAETKAARMNGLVHVEDVMGTAVVLDLRWRARPRAGRASRMPWSTPYRCLHDVDLVFSTWRPDSAVSRLRRAETGLQSCPPEVRAVVLLCVRADASDRRLVRPVADARRLRPDGARQGVGREAGGCPALGRRHHRPLRERRRRRVRHRLGRAGTEPDSWTVGDHRPRSEPSRLLTVVTVPGGARRDLRWLRARTARRRSRSPACRS